MHQILYRISTYGHDAEIWAEMLQPSKQASLKKSFYESRDDILEKQMFTKKPTFGQLGP